MKRSRLVAALAVGVITIAPGAARALLHSSSVSAPTSYSGSASATGVSVVLDIPGAPLSDQLVDTGGPTAQATADSLGVGQGYAALPDPGPIVQVAPGLLIGLLNQGAAGLPPIKLPSLPPYPASVTANALNPDASAGAGPYQLGAHAKVGQAQATATGGVQTSAIGNASLLTSAASVLPTTDATVVATSTSDVQGLTIALLTIGEIKTTATATLSGDGTVAYTDSIAISGLQVGGVGVSLDGSTLTTPGPVIPLPLNATLAQLLRATGVTVKIAPAQTFADRVIAPAIQITVPANVKIGSAPGTVSMTFGAVTASLSGVAPGGSGSDVVVPPAGGSGSTTGTGIDTSLGGSGSPLVQTPAVGTVPFTPAPAPVGPPAAAAVAVRPAVAVRGVFDVQSLYLELAASALAIGLISQLARLMGVRRRWTSSAG